ncbi:MAG: hypothetical protein ACHQU0_03085 [Candidatus Paceibacteria bacterium]
MTTKKEVEKTAEQIAEETAAAESIKAHKSVVANADPKSLSASKVEMMKHMAGIAAGLGHDDLTKWYEQSVALIGHEADKVGDNSGKNKAGIAMKPSDANGKGAGRKDPMPKIASITPGQVSKEAVEALFDGEDLTEEFKEKTSTLFEAALATQLIIAKAEILEAAETELEAAIEANANETAENVDKYLDYVVETWIKENEVAIDTGLQVEFAKDFIVGLKNLFAEHYVEIPEDKAEVVENLATKVTELEAALNEQITSNSELKARLVESDKAAVVEELADGMVMTQAEKFKSLAEAIDFDGDVEVYKKKLMLVKEKHFSTEKPLHESNIETENFIDGDDGSKGAPAVSNDPTIAAYANAFKTVKRG